MDILKKNKHKVIKKILFVSHKIAHGGAERVVTILSSELADSGYQVGLILYKREEEEYPISNKVRIYLLPDNKKQDVKALYLLKKFFYFRRLVEQISPDYIVPFLPYQNIQTYFVTRGLGIPMAYTVRNDPRHEITSGVTRKLRDLIAERVESVFFQTEIQKEYFNDRIARKSFVLPNPVNKSILNQAYVAGKDIRQIVSLGRLEKQKNFELLIRGVVAVKKEITGLVLDIYGEGSQKKELEALIQKLDANDYIHLCGRTSNVAEVLKQHDLFIMTSDYEGMPNALMEAMGVGLPCISTDCPTGPKELLSYNNCGVLIPMNSQNDLEDAVRWAANNCDDAVAMGSRARNNILSNYSPSMISHRLIVELEKRMD